LINQQGQHIAKQILKLEFVVVLIGSVLWWGFGDWQKAYSGLIGGLVYILPLWYFSIKAFSHGGARSAKKITRSFYMGQSVRIALMIASFSMAYLYLNVDPTAMISIFFVCVFTQHFGLLIKY
jgi:ATP synthase protein I